MAALDLRILSFYRQSTSDFLKNKIVMKTVFGIDLIQNDKMAAFLAILMTSVIIVTTILINLTLVPSYWLDELYSVTLVQQNFDFMIENIFGDVHPPLYYFLLKIWSALGGHSEFYIRSLSALFAVGTIMSIYLMRRHLDRLSAPIFMLLIFCNHLFLYSSQEARYNSLLFLLTTIATLFLFRFDKNKNRLLPIFIICTALSFLHYFGVLFAVCVYSVLALEHRRQFVRLAQISLATLLACSWPIAHLLLSSLAEDIGNDLFIWFEVDGPLDTVRIAACASASLVCATSRVAPTALIGGALVVATGLALLRWFPWRTLKQDSYSGPVRLILLCLLFLSGVAVVDLVVPVSRVRYYIALLPPVYLLLAIFLAGLVRDRPKAAKAAVLLLAVFLALQGAHSAKMLSVKMMKPENWVEMAKTAMDSTGDQGGLFYYDHDIRDSDWHGMMYNFYVHRLSGGERRARPLRLDQAKDADLPYVVMFCHISEDKFDLMSAELRTHFQVDPTLINNTAYNSKTCGLFQVPR